MDFSGYLAMTGAEIAACNRFPPKIACMSCHFSPSGQGLHGLPSALPPGSVLMLTDEIPLGDQTPARIARELAAAADSLGCRAVVLDLQRPGRKETQHLVEAVTEALPCPLVVSELYAGPDHSVLLAAPPLWTPLQEHLKPWEGRSIWLEAVLDGATVTVTETKSRYTPCEPEPLSQFHTEPRLHITYHVEVLETETRFHLRREKQALSDLLEEAKALGVAEFVGLYQQLAPCQNPETQ